MHNSAVRLVHGVFRTIPIVSLYYKANILPSSHQRQFILLNFNVQFWETVFLTFFFFVLFDFHLSNGSFQLFPNQKLSFFRHPITKLIKLDLRNINPNILLSHSHYKLSKSLDYFGRIMKLFDIVFLLFILFFFFQPKFFPLNLQRTQHLIFGYWKNPNQHKFSLPFIKVFPSVFFVSCPIVEKIPNILISTLVFHSLCFIFVVLQTYPSATILLTSSLKKLFFSLSQLYLNK